MANSTHRTEKERSRCQAESDNGNTYTVIEFQEYREFRSLNGPDQIVPSLRRYALSDGRPVNQIDSETFQIVETDEIIRKFG